MKSFEPNQLRNLVSMFMKLLNQTGAKSSHLKPNVAEVSSLPPIVV